MKLYYSPGACSLAAHIVLRETGLPFELVQVDLKTHTTKEGKDFYAIHSKGYVPFLVLDNGEQLSEVAVIIQNLSDQVPGRHMLPAVNTMERYHALEWLNYIATELHKSFGPLFSSTAPAETKQSATDKLSKNFSWVNKQLEGKQYLMGDDFGAADAYMFAMARWAYWLKVPMDGYSNFKAYFDRMKEIPSIKEALAKEGLKG